MRCRSQCCYERAKPPTKWRKRMNNCGQTIAENYHQFWPTIFKERTPSLIDKIIFIKMCWPKQRPRRNVTNAKNKCELACCVMWDFVAKKFCIEKSDQETLSQNDTHLCRWRRRFLQDHQSFFYNSDTRCGARSVQHIWARRGRECYEQQKPIFKTFIWRQKFPYSTDFKWQQLWMQILFDFWLSGNNLLGLSNRYWVLAKRRIKFIQWTPPSDLITPLNLYSFRRNFLPH